MFSGVTVTVTLPLRVLPSFVNVPVVLLVDPSDVSVQSIVELQVVLLTFGVQSPVPESSGSLSFSGVRAGQAGSPDGAETAVIFAESATSHEAAAPLELEELLLELLVDELLVESLLQATTKTPATTAQPTRTDASEAFMRQRYDCASSRLNRPKG